MSASSVRRVKERGGGGKLAAAPTGKVSPVPGRSISAGKENPRPTSRVRAATQKPTVRPIARVDKTAAAPAVEEPRFRRSNSSVVPRGRSSSPSEVTRVLSDLRKNSSRVSLGSSRKKEIGSVLKDLNGKKYDFEKGVSKDLMKNGEILGELQENQKVSELEKRAFKDFEKIGRNFQKVDGDSRENEKVNLRVLKGNDEEKERYLSSTLVLRSDLEDFNQNSTLEAHLKSNKLSEAVKVKSSTVGVSSSESKLATKVSNCTGASKEIGANKYPSRLHEKLAFLEGKVKRIASDIKRTKEMLDMNNPDASKMILSDIQEKITGIEKAMVYVAGSDGDSKVGSVESRENDVQKEEKEVLGAKSSANGLNVEDLEARLFPHHKLIRDRTLSRTTSRGSGTCAVRGGESIKALDHDEKSATFDDDVIAKEETHGGSEAASEVHQMDVSMTCTAEGSYLSEWNGNTDALMTDEKLDDFDEEERMPTMIIEEEDQDDYVYKLTDIGCKTTTGGWFVSEGESVLLAHDDGSCSFYDIANSEEKAQYRPPVGVVPNIWQDCWIIRAPSADGCSGRYVVAASAGNSVHSGFCSWDFYTKQIRASHIEEETPRVRTALAPLSNNTMYERNTLSSAMATENRQWWYRPCGTLIASTASCQRKVQLYDIRDGEHVMKWELAKPVIAMDYSSPLQWRSRGKLAIAESEAVSLWDVNSLNSQELLSVSSSGRKISALYVNNIDAELGGGVRQRVSSGEVEGNDGVFCTSDSINVLDFRQPSGIALKIPKVGADVQSVFSRGDSIYIGCSSLKSAAKKQYTSQIQQFSLRKQRLFSTYSLPESNAHSHFTALTQVWGNSNLVMGVCGLGLFIFDSLKDDGLPSFAMDYSSPQNVKEVIGPDDMYNPSFDYLASRILLISKDRPARWRYLD